MYVLLGNYGRATLFKGLKRDKDFKLIKKFKNDQYTKKESKIFTDRAGTGSTSYTNDQAKLGENNFKSQLGLNFCNKIIDFIDKRIKNEKLSNLIIIGGPSFIGGLRKKMPSHMLNEVDRMVSKNIYTEKEHELKNILNNEKHEIFPEN